MQISSCFTRNSFDYICVIYKKKSMGEQWRVKSGPCDPRWHSSDLLFRIRKECLGRRRRSTGSYRDKYIMKTKISSLIGFLVCMWHLKEFA